jgi:hypothetical protein
VLDIACDAAKEWKSTRRAVLQAACRVAVYHPPAWPTAYPTLNVASQRITVEITRDLYAPVVAVETDYFYGRLAWLCFYGLVHNGSLTLRTYHAYEPAHLAHLDQLAYQRLAGGQPCTIPAARAPMSPRVRGG